VGIRLLAGAIAVTTTLAVAVALPTTTSSATTSLTLAELAAARPAFEAVGLGYGTRIDASDVLRLAGLLGLDVGTVLDPADLDRVLAVAASRTPPPAPAAPTAPAPVAAPVLAAETEATLAAIFEALGVGYGTRIDEADLRALATRLRVDVGTVVDPADVDRLVAAGRRATEVFPVFATVGGVTVHQVGRDVAVIGYHQSNHEGARDLSPVGSATPWEVLPSRERLSGPRSAADIVVARGTEVRSPVTGTVKRAGTYTLYCRYTDGYVVIEPDEHPGWEVKLLHISGVSVQQGQRVTAGRTLVARGPNPLPFASQVDEHNATGWPHVHLEVVDLAIPDVRNPGSGSSC
jgi:biotin carboxyl carrier protein